MTKDAGHFIIKAEKYNGDKKVSKRYARRRARKRHLRRRLPLLLGSAVFLLLCCTVFLIGKESDRTVDELSRLYAVGGHFMKTTLENLSYEKSLEELREPSGPAASLPDSNAVEEMPPDISPQEPVLEEERILLELLRQLSLEEKVGQMFIARCPSENAVNNIKDFHLGGYILFARDFEGITREQAKVKIQGFQEASPIPMLIGVDEEGGSVTRVSRFPAFRDAPFPSSQELYQAGGFEAVKADAWEKSRLLKETGVNVNFAPVADVSQNPEDFIFKRSFGQSADLTAQYVETIVNVMQEEGMGCVLKHFPGYGNNADTHTGIAYDSRPYDTFVSSDFLPFQAGIRAGADCVLVSHNIVKCMDESLPASLSPRVHDILRNDLGFSGVIVTDDLYMDGIRDFTDASQAAVAAVQAGNDLLCCTDFTVQIPAVIRAVESGEIPEARIDESVLRILKMKHSLGLL